jgi:transketolase
MEPAVEARFARIESLLHAMAERENQIEARARRSEARFERWNEITTRKHQEAMQRMDRTDQRMEKFDQRMEKFDLRLEATRKLVEAGMKLLVRMNSRIDGLAADVKDLKKSQKAFLDSLKKSANGAH